MADQPITLLAHIEALPGRAEALLQQARQAVAASRQEPGCEFYMLHQEAQNADKLVFYERYASQAAFDSHVQMPYLLRFQQFLAANAVGGAPVVTFLTRLD